MQKEEGAGCYDVLKLPLGGVGQAFGVRSKKKAEDSSDGARYIPNGFPVRAAELLWSSVVVWVGRRLCPHKSLAFEVGVVWPTSAIPPRKKKPTSQVETPHDGTVSCASV